MLGCKALDQLVNRSKLMGEIDERYFNGVHFVIGDVLTEQDREQFIKDIDVLLSSISPEILQNKDVITRFLPVLPSKLNKGYAMNEVYGSASIKDRYIILLAVRPFSKQYSDKLT